MASTHMCYFSLGCNRVPHCADWGQNGLLCYGSHHGVVIYRPDGWADKPAETLNVLAGHTDRVNCVRWIPRHLSDASDGNETELVSCSVDKTAIIWKLDNDQYEQVAVLRGHSGPVTVASALHLHSQAASADQTPDTIVVTASSDSTLKCWKRQSNSSEVTEIQTLTFGTGFVLDVCLLLIPDTQVPLMACGVDDHKVHLFVMQQNQFVCVMTLPGHEDWVRGVHLTVDDDREVLLASCGQDSLIRLWRLSQRDSENTSSTTTSTIRDLPRDQDIRMKEKTFAYLVQEGEKGYFAVTLESVLSGHEGWIYSVRWQPPLKNEKTGRWTQRQRLLSASMDKTMIVWAPDAKDGLWVEQVRVGEVGGNTLGLYGGLFGPRGDSILAHGYQGALHQWIHNKDSETWEPAVTGGGHFGSVEDVDWDRYHGDFLLSTSVDQTTRLHAPWVREGRFVAWYEMTRPQVHGYDMQCVCVISRFVFASAADEKVARVFQAPKNFIQNLCSLCGFDLTAEMEKEEVKSLPEGARVPALGLSNKAVYEGSKIAEDDRIISAAPNQQYADAYFSPQHLTAPASEEHLVQNTLWPEVHKLYGHGYEVFALTSNPAGTLLASACKATKAEHANILLWDTKTWQRVDSLEGSSLTVVQMAFSPSGRFLLAVSRDRTWSLYSCEDGKFSRVSYVDKKTSAHSRIIWACAWSNDERFFFTGSRDKKVLVWSVVGVTQTQPPQPTSALDMADSVTAVDIAPVMLADGRYLLATGLDGGEIGLHTWSGQQGAGDNGHWSHTSLDKRHHHLKTVKRLRFRPVLGLAGQKQTDSEQSSWIQLASCGADHCVKVHNIKLDAL